MSHSYTLFLSLFLILTTSKLLGEITRKLFKSSLLGEITAGIILGPTLFGFLFPEIYMKIFGDQTFKNFLSLFNNIAVVMLLLIAGMESDLKSIFKQKVILISAPSKIIISLIVSFVIFHYFIDINYNNVDPFIFTISMGFALAITALPVLVRILSELNIYRSDIGMSLVGTAMFIDMIIWIGFSVLIILYKRAYYTDLYNIFFNIMLVVIFVLLILTLIRKAVDMVLPYIQSKLSWPDGVLAFVFSLCLLFATITETLGTHAIIGAFLSGVILSDSEHFKEKIQYRIEGIVNAFFSPIYFGSLGIFINFIQNINIWLTLLFLILVILISISAGYLPYRYINKSAREGLGFGYGLATLGATDIIFMSLLLSLKLVNEMVFASFVLTVLIIVLTSPLILRTILATRYYYKFYDYLTDKLFISHFNADSDKKAIEFLCKKIADIYNLDYEKITKTVLEREELMPTGIENGIAIPHGRIDGLKKPIIAVGISETGIDFGSRDGGRSHLIFLILTPNDNPQIQLEILADIAKTFKYFDPHLIFGIKSLNQFISFIRNELLAK